MKRAVATLLIIFITGATFAESAEPPTLPGIRVDRDAGLVDLSAVVVNREPEWLELLACTPGSLDHESILAIEARPSHVHLALLLLGIEPGQPSRPVRDGDRVVVQPPTGPEIGVSLVYEHEGETVEVPANRWVLNRETDQHLTDHRWLFTGSVWMDFQGKRHYLADQSGTAITLVNFNDDLLARPTELSRDNDGQQWMANTEAIPPLDTPVTIRLRPITDE